MRNLCDKQKYVCNYKMRVLSVSVIIFFLISIIYFKMHHSSLISQSNKIIRLQPNYSVRWISNNEFAVANTRLSMSRYNIVTQELKLETRWTNLLERAKVGYVSPQSLQVSPDGKWLLWKGTIGVLVSTENGSHFFSCPLGMKRGLCWPVPNMVMWTSDGKYLIEISENMRDTQHRYTNIILHSPDDPFRLESIPIKSTDLLNSVTGGSRSISAVSVNNLLVVGYDLTSTVDNVEIVRTDLSRKVPSKKYKIQLPTHAMIRDIVFSPKGDRLILKLAILQESSMSRILHGLFPTLTNWSESIVELWVCETDGSGMQLLGRITNKTNSESEEENFPDIDDLQWLPNGKRLSFLHQGVLWILDM